MPIFKLSAIERRRFSAFVSCFFIAVAAWVLVTLSGSYEYTVKRVVNFKNSPQKRAYNSLQSDTVDVTMKGNGWQMLFSQIKDNAKPITIDLHTLDSHDFVILNKQLAQINAQYDTINYVVSIDPDTLYFNFSNRISKTVKVKLLSNLSFEQGYALADKVIIKPDEVTISGPTERVIGIKEWPSDSLIVKNLNEKYSTRLGVKLVEDGSLSVFPKQVEVKLPVDEFTEKTLDIPIKLLNQNYENVKTFPQKVRITFTVSLKKYAETTEDFFSATADMNLWRNRGYSMLPVQLLRKPSFCKIVSVEPRNIDFIVKK